MGRAPQIIRDRRFAIRSALRIALSLSTVSLSNPSKDTVPLDSARGPRNQNSIAVLITGKGTDPFIMGPRGSKEPWSDAQVVREELERLLGEV